MFPMMLADVNPIQLLELFGGLTGLGFGLFNNWRSRRRIQEMTAAGGMPGTGEPVAGLFPDGTEEMIREGAQYDPRIAMLPAQYEENERARDKRRHYGDTALSTIENSGLKDLGETVEGWRTGFDEYLSTGAGGDDPFSREHKRLTGDIERRRGVSTDLADRIKALNEETKAEFQETIDDPTVMSDNEMDAIVGRMMGSNRQWAESRARGVESDAGARGLSRSAVRAMKEGVAGDERGLNLDAIAEVARVNAENRATNRQRAIEAKGTIGGDLFSREGQFQTMFEPFNAADSARISDLATNMPLRLVGLEGDLDRTYEDRLYSALYDRAEIEQPENLLLIGDLLAETGRFNALTEAGAYDAAANLFANTGSGFLDMFGAEREADAMLEAQEEDSSFLTPLLAGLGGGAGTAGAAGLLSWLSSLGPTATIGGKMAVMICLDAETLVDVRNCGETPLRAVRIGQEIRTPRGYVRIVDKDIGAPHPDNNEWVEIVAGDRVLRLTTTHEIAGMPAGHYEAGDIIETPTGYVTIDDVRTAEPPAAAADVKLAGGGGYLAGGFYVDSMFESEVKHAATA